MMWYRYLVSFNVYQNSLDYKKRWFGRLAYKYGKKERETEIRDNTESKCLQWILVSSDLMKSPIFLYYSLLAFYFQSIIKTRLPIFQNEAKKTRDIIAKLHTVPQSIECPNSFLRAKEVTVYHLGGDTFSYPSPRNPSHAYHSYL